MDLRFHTFEQKVEDWHWWYRGRRQILEQLLGSPSSESSRALLLDLGCGTGGSAPVLSRHGRVIAFDRAHSSFALAPGRPYAHRVIGSAEELPFAAGIFDLVCALDILEHLDDDLGGAREILRVLRPGGTAIIFVPALRVLWGRNDLHSHHRRRYTSGGLCRLMENAGFSVERHGYFNFLLFMPTLIARLVERIAPEFVGRFEYREQPSSLNEILARIFSMEVAWMRYIALPLGTSAYCLAKRSFS